MTRTCAWCGKAMPPRRTGRKGARRFCGKPHERAFTALAYRLGAEALDRSGVPAEGVARARERLGKEAVRLFEIEPGGLMPEASR